eukprot:352441-Chlamydomonas_euryale.AAC.7
MPHIQRLEEKLHGSCIRTAKSAHPRPPREEATWKLCQHSQILSGNSNWGAGQGAARLQPYRGGQHKLGRESGTWANVRLATCLPCAPF